MKKVLIFVFILVLAVFIIHNVNAQEYGVDEFTAALWHMNEGSGSTIFDETSNNPGTINGATWTTEGKFGNALNFDGVNDFVGVPYSQSIGQLPEVTLEAWIKRNSQSDGMVISKNGPYFLSVRNNVIEGGVYAGPGWTHINGITELEMGTWYHIALTYDGSFIKIYLNGLEDSSLPKTGNILVTGQGLHMGWGEPGHNQYFNGIIDEVRISNIARTNFNMSEPEPDLEERVAELESRVDELENQTFAIENLLNSFSEAIVDFIEGLPQGLRNNWNGF